MGGDRVLGVVWYFSSNICITPSFLGLGNGTIVFAVADLGGVAQEIFRRMVNASLTGHSKLSWPSLAERSHPPLYDVTFVWQIQRNKAQTMNILGGTNGKAKK